MNLKEAFRYQNKLQRFLETALDILRDDDNLTKVKTTYLRHKVMPEAEDETVQLIPENDYYNRITEMVLFASNLLAEREKLSAAIRKAKDALDMDMDGEVSLNSLRQEVAARLAHMNDLRTVEKTVINGGTGYRFNAEGNQISYRCDTKRVSTINFNRNVVRAELEKLNKKSDATSAAIDLCLVNSSVDYEPPFDVNCSFADAFEKFAGPEL